MRVAISSLGPSLDARVDERFGRAAYLLIVDGDTLAVQAVDNSANRDALQGSGLGAAEIASEHGATLVITGHLGPKAYSALQRCGISGYDGTGMTVRGALEELRSGKLARLSEGEAHAGID
jgi:predicted Fe-Mo cluster-binding NifX family protein